MKRMLLGAILFWSSLGFGQDTLGFQTRIFQNMVRFVANRPQEKVYLHTDRDHYTAGEQVWFRAYLVNGVTHKTVDYNSFVYVELADRQDSVWQRVKIRRCDSVYAGYLPLGERLPQGDYYLRAYTYWMQNVGDDFLPRKRIRVINPRDAKALTSVSNEKEGKNIGRIRSSNSRNETCKKDFAVDFFPEGGHLLAGNQQAVAFKAVGTNGLSCEVEGGVFNDLDEQVAWIQSLHKGMGGFELPVEAGRRYYARLTVPGGEEKKVELPTPVHYGAALKVVANREMLAYSVLVGDSTRLPEEMYILVHIGGVPLLVTRLDEGRKGVVPLEEVPEGILHVLLMDARGEVYSERLCFLRKKQPVVWVETDKPRYFIRDLVNMRINVLCDSLAERGSFSVAVTDDSQCERDSAAGNILTSLLLTSDLRGYVEDPAFYFRDNRITTRRCLDLLMLTQGWTRFRVPDIALGKYPEAPFYLEQGQAISGKVKNFWGKEATNANLILLSTSGIVRMVEADSSGHFVIDGISFPDSTRFVLQGRSKKGRRSVEVVMDEDRFLPLVKRFPYDEQTRAEEERFYEKFRKDYYYDNGVKVYVLDEAVVKRKVRPKLYSFYDAMADYSLDSARLAAFGDTDLRVVLQEIPGVDCWGDSIMRWGKKLYVLVNDLVQEMDYVMRLQPRDLVSISLVQSPVSTTLFGREAENGALVITTNPRFVPRDIPRPNMAHFTTLGYQKKAEFYMPRYEVDSVRLALADSLDRRVTVYWNPDVRTDAGGAASCFFTTSDSEGPYTVVIEGILRNGTVCRQEEKVFLRNR